MSHDTLIHRLVRPAVRPLAKSAVTPNHLTVVRLLTGLLAGAAFAGGARWRDLGAGVFLVSLLLDRADGELARQSGKTSVAGYRFDLVCDCIATVAAFVGLGAGLLDRLGVSALALGAAAGASVVGLFYLLNVAKTSRTLGVGARGRTLIDPDDALALLPVLVWLGLPEVTLVVAGSLTPALMLALLLRARLKRPPRRLETDA